MSTESISDRREHIRSVGVTALAALLGVAAALASMAVTGDLPAREAAGETLPQAFVVVAILVQLALLNVTNIYDEDEFGMKHNLYVAFMTFSFWFITWGILLTSEAA